MRVICLEGCSGTGKTTNHKKINDYLRNQNIRYLCAIEKDYEPFKTEVEKWHRDKGPLRPFTYKDVRNFAKARVETFRRRFLTQGLDLLVLDRFYYTSAVYQSNQTLSPEEIIDINLEEGAIIPDRTFLLDCHPEESFSRSQERNKMTGGKSLFSTSPGKIKELRIKYIQLMENHPEIFLVDSSRPLEEVNNLLINQIRELIDIY